MKISIIPLFLISIVPTTTAVVSYTCDYKADPCPYQGNKVCEADGSVPECPLGTSDCFDCDPCQQWNDDCGGCVENGCHYCGADRLCSSQPLLDDFWVKSPFHSVCNTEEAWDTTCTTTSNNNGLFSDPYYETNEWAFDMLNVKPVWKQGITGKGVMVRVNDLEGVDLTSPEFAGKVNFEASCAAWEPPQDPTQAHGPVKIHGTNVASIAVGGGNNGECSVGIAPDASLSACLGPIVSNSDNEAADFILKGLDTTHVSVNAWGFDSCLNNPLPPEATVPPEASSNGVGGRHERSLQESCPFVGDHPSSSPDYPGTLNNPCQFCPENGFELSSPQCSTYISIYCEHGNREVNYVPCAEYQDRFVNCNFNALTNVGREALARGVTEGRGGKGIVFMFAAGNEYKLWEDVNDEGWLNSRFTNVVAALDKNERHGSFSTSGAAILVSAPGGDWDNYGTEGWMSAMPVANGGGCTDSSFGTSFATPAVAGVVALMLEANPELGWRDVQAILASTAKKVDEKNPTWVTNGSLLHHSNLYGFGAVDALAAVEIAKTWNNFGPEKEIMMDSGAINLPILDDPASVSSTSIAVDSPLHTNVESVVVYLELDHPARGDLEVVLTSPAGTQSVLQAGYRRENTRLSAEQRWKLLTVKNYGESANGEWTLSLTDKRQGTHGDCVDYPILIQFHEDPYGDIAWNCDGFQKLCKNSGAVPPESIEILDWRDETTGQNPAEACCACGGGDRQPTTTTPKLVSWKLAIYGHEHRVFESNFGKVDETNQSEESKDSGSGSEESKGSGSGARQNVVAFGLVFGLVSFFGGLV